MLLRWKNKQQKKQKQNKTHVACHIVKFEVYVKIFWNAFSNLITYYVPFLTNTLGKSMKPLISPSMG